MSLSHMIRRTLAAALLAACGAGGTGPSPDGTSPNVAIVTPAPGAAVSGQVAININASDDFGVDKVRISVDGVLLAEVYSTPYRVIWNTLPLTDNSVHTILAEAFDLSQNHSQQSIQVTVHTQQQ